MVEEGDLISIDIPGQTIEVVGFKGKHENKEEVDSKLQERAGAWKGFEKKREGVLGLFTGMAGDTQKGASMLKGLDAFPR